MRRIRKRTVIVLFLLVLSVGGYLLFDWFGDNLVQTAILLNVLGMFNVVLIVILTFMLLRSIVKPMLEGRRLPRLNLTLRVKMTIFSLLLVMVPSGVIVGMGTVIIYNILDNWHNPELSQSMEAAQKLAADYEASVAAETAQFARVLGEEITLDLLQKREDIPIFLRTRLDRYRLSSIEIYRNGELLAMIRNENEPLQSLQPANLGYRDQLARGESFHNIMPLSVGTYVRFGTLLPIGEDISDRYTVVTGKLIIRNMTRYLNSLKTAVSRYENTQESIQSLKIFNISSLLLIAILAIFSGMWAGFKFTDNFLRAFNLLLLGTERVSRGELDFGIEVRGRDEMGRLMQSFNLMIDKLRTHEQELRLRAIEMESINQFLEDKKHYFEAVLNCLPVGVISISNFGNVQSINRFARDILGIRSRVEEGTRLVSILSTDDDGARRLNEMVDHMMQDMEPSLRQSLVFEGEDGPRSTDVTITHLTARLSEDIGYLIIIEDITKLEQAQKMLAWKEAVRRIVHELKNPLTPIKLAAERIRFKAEKGPDGLRDVVLDSVKPMIEEIIAMQRLIENFSRYAKMPPPRVQSVDIHELLDETIHLVEPEAGSVAIRKLYATSLAPMNLDRDLIKSAFLNIMRNALAAMEADEKGTLTVKSIYFAAGHRVQVEISDTGQGIPQDLKEKIFIPYFSTKAKGDGLGLAIVHNIITAHGGHVHVKDNFPRGSTFVIDLPVG